ncbi:hypothetical protein Peur_011842 [Populus x canadensis]
MGTVSVCKDDEVVAERRRKNEQRLEGGGDSFCFKRENGCCLRVGEERELNVVLSSSGQANVDEDDDDIHIKNCDGVDDYSIDNEEEENSD